MAAMHATTTGTGLTLGAGDERLWSPRRLMDRCRALLSGAARLDASHEEALAGSLDRVRELRDAALWSTRSSRLG
jgi:hypothetical protein